MEAIPVESYIIDKPTFFSGAKQDVVCVSSVGQQVCRTYCRDLTIEEFDAGYWLAISAAREVNMGLMERIIKVHGKP